MSDVGCHKEVGHGKDYGFYSNYNGKSLKDSSGGINIFIVVMWYFSSTDRV